MADEPGPLQSRAASERDEAHRRFNEAFNLVDQARQQSPAWPDVPPRYDEEKLHEINSKWNTLPEGLPPRPPGWRGWLADFVWRTIEPVMKRQIDFNADLVEHLNRNTVPHREANDAVGAIVLGLRDGFNGVCLFEHMLVHFLQTITPLVDTRERVVREALDELRHVAELAHRAAAMARREAERAGGSVPAAREAVPGAPAALPASVSVPGTPAPLRTREADHAQYVGFEDRFRGTEQEIRARLAEYVPYFAGASNVIDLGCGRGEFLDLLREAGVSARGIDLNVEMVEVCRARGLDAAAGDGLSVLAAEPDESLGGLLAVQVVEHLEPAYLQRLLRTAFDKLRPGAPLIVETINPACWVAFFESYIRDLSHVRPIHPETLQYLLHASGFSQVALAYRAPVAENARLQRVKPAVERFGAGETDPLTELVTAFNRNVERLNSHLFTYQDYAAIARRP